MAAMRSLMIVALLAPVAGCLLAREGTGVEQDEEPSATSASVGGFGPAGAGATTSIGGATTAVSTTTTTNGSGGSGAVESDCTNGVDDDLDGSPDCDDPDCIGAGYMCLPSVSGAIAQLALTGGVCPDASMPTTLRRCDDAGCSCSAIDGTCGFAVERWDGGSCAGPASSSPKTAPGCFVTSATVNSSFKASASPHANSACVASTPTVVAADIGACEVTGGSCSSGGACVPPTFPVAQSCVLLPPGSTCAAPYDGHRETIYDDPAATCSCSCNKTGQSCAGTFSSYLGYPDVCAPPPTAAIPFDNVCHPVGNIDSYTITTPTEQPQCSAQTAMPGEAVLCCTQPPA